MRLQCSWLSRKLSPATCQWKNAMRQSSAADGRTQVLCSVDVVSEGTDVPAVSAAILLRPTQSEALYLQQVGRILRPQPERSQLFWITLAALSNMASMTFALVTRRKPKRKKASEPAPSVRSARCVAAFKPQPVCPAAGMSSRSSQSVS